MPPRNITLVSDAQQEHVAYAAPSQSIITRGGDALSRWLLVLLFAVLPIFVIPTPWAAIAQSKVMLATAILIIALLAWAIARIFEGAVHVPRSWLVYVTLLLPLAYVISTVVARWNATSIVGQGVEQDTLVAVVVWYAAFALTAFVFAGNRAAIRICVRALIIGFTLLMILETLYVFYPSWFSFGGALSGNTANPLGSWHDLAIIAGLAIFASIALFRSSIFNGVWRGILVILGLVSFFLLFLVHFSDVFWGVTVLCVAGFIAVLRASLQAEGVSLTNALGRALPWLVLGVAMALSAIFSVQIAARYPARLQITEVEVRPSWQGTLDVAKQSLGGPTSLLFGSGPNSFIREWALHKPQSVNLTPFWNSDFNYGIGVIPTSIFAVGLFGLLAWAALLLVLLGLLFRFAREVRPLSAGRTLFGVLVVAVGYLVGFHMIYTPGVAVTGITFLLLGLLAVAAAGDASLRTFRVGVTSLSRLIFLVILVVFTGVGVAAAGTQGREVLSNLYLNRGAYAYQQNGDIAAASHAIQESLAIVPNNDLAHRAAAELGILELSQLIQNQNPDDAARKQLQTTLQDTIQHGLTAVQIDGSNYQNWLSLAQIYANLAGANVQGALDNAKGAYQKAFEAQPTNPVPKLRLAQLAVAQNDLPSARANLQQAVALKPDFAAAYYLLSQVEAADGKGDAAVQAAAQAVQLVPSDPVGWFNLGYILYSGHSYPDAASALEKAATLTPDYANALFILGLTYNAQGRTDDAIAVLTRVVQLNTGETWLPQLLQNVKDKKDPFAGIQQGGAATPAAATSTPAAAR